MKSQEFARSAQKTQASPDSLRLEDGSRVGVMGGGPAGSLFGYFILEMADRAGLDLHVDIYEPRDFSLPGPQGCNMCAGIISESLIQMLALEGINLPPTIVQRGMDSYTLHNEVGSVSLSALNAEKRIGTVFRGVGPLGSQPSEWSSFDGFLLDRVIQRGAKLFRRRIEAIDRVDGGRLLLKTRIEPAQSYDLLAVATGVNTSALRLFQQMDLGFQPPRLAQAYIREYFLGKNRVEHIFGHTIHYFLLDLNGLDFAAIVPKGDYVTVCLLGKDLNQAVFEAFLDTPQVKSCMPPDWQSGAYVCHCAPRLNVAGAIHPFADRMIFLGDSAVSHLYKDGMGASYRAAKAAAAAVIFGGISEKELARQYGRYCKQMEKDNTIGKLIFGIVGIIKPWHLACRAVLRMISSEQAENADERWMSAIIWDIFTGSAPYGDIFSRMLRPAFWARFAWHIGASALRSP